jgi:hypothetical protein
MAYTRDEGAGAMTPSIRALFLATLSMMPLTIMIFSKMTKSILAKRKAIIN